MEKKNEMSKYLQPIEEDTDSDETTSQYSFAKPQFVSAKLLIENKNIVRPERRVTNDRRTTMKSVKSTLSKKSDIGNKVNSPETSVEEFLAFFTDLHPLFHKNLSNFKILVKSEDFHLYSVVQNKR